MRNINDEMKTDNRLTCTKIILNSLLLIAFLILPFSSYGYKKHRRNK